MLLIQILQELVKEKVDWYLHELTWELDLQTDKLVSIPTLWRSSVYCGISKKKSKFEDFFSLYCVMIFTINFISPVTSRHPMSETNFPDIYCED